MSINFQKIAIGTGAFFIGCFLITLMWIYASHQRTIVSSSQDETLAEEAVVNQSILPEEFSSAYLATLTTRASYGLGPSKYIAVDTLDGLWLFNTETREVKIIPETEPVADAYSLGPSLLLEPTDQPNVLYFITRRKGFIGPVYRVNLENNQITRNNRVGGSWIIVSPHEDQILLPGSNTYKEYVDQTCDSRIEPCLLEAFAFSLYDLELQVQIIAKLPEGYSYAVTNYPPNLMAEDLMPKTVTTWVDDQITSEVYSTTEPLEPGVNRTAMRSVTFSPNQTNVEWVDGEETK